MSFAISKSLHCFVLLLAITPIAKPISKDAAKYAAIAGGSAVAMGAGVLTHKSLTSLHDFHGKTKPILISSSIGLAAGGAAGYYFYKWLYSLTPEAKAAALKALAEKRLFELVTIIKTIEMTVQEIDFDPLSNTFTDTDNLIANLVARFDKFSWPLVLGKNLLSQNLQTLKEALKTISLVQPEIQQNKNCATLAQKCSQLITQIMALSSRININLISIIKHEKYDFQAQLYEQVNGTERYFKFQSQENNKQRQSRNDLVKPDQLRPINFNV